MLLALGSLLGLPVRAAADGPTTFSNTASIAIPATGSANQTGPASPYPSNITVSGMTGAVTKVTVTFHNLSHTILNDIDAMVVAPSGNNLVVLSDAANPNTFTFATNATLTFDDNGSAFPGAGNVPTGTYRPTNRDDGKADSFPAPAPTPSSDTTFAEAFTGVSGSGLNGTWSLFAVDDTQGDLGTMAGGWSLTITTAADAATTTTTVSSSDSTSTTGDSVTFTATVAAGATPVTNGTVQFAADGVSFGGARPLSASGIATVATSSLTEGSHVIRATYSGTTGFLGSSNIVNQRVDNATVVTGNTFCNTGPITPPDRGIATPYPSNIFVTGLAGQITKVTASLKGLSHRAPIDYDILLSGPTPATNVILLSDAGGQEQVSNLTVNFDDSAATGVSSPMVSGTFKPTNLTSDAADSFPAPAPTPSSATTLSTFNEASGNGTWSLWVVDDATGDSGSIDGGWCLTITSQSPTVTQLTASPNPSTFGQSVALTATVTSGGNPVTTGSVQFSDGGTALGTPVAVNGSGVATLTTSVLAVGSHPITATYGGTATLATSTGNVTQVVDRAPTTTDLTSSLNPSDVGESVTFTATVTADDGAVTAGSVQFAVDGANTGGAVAVGADGLARLMTGALTAGRHEITATYSGTVTFGGSSDTVDQDVERISTTTVLASSLNPSAFNQAVTFTATVTADGGRPVSGSVRFAIDGSPLGAPVPVAADGTAVVTTSGLAAGAHTITASFVPPASLVGSSADLVQVVGQAGSTVSVTGAPNPSTYGQSVTFTATVSSTAAVGGAGTVQFSVGGTDLGGPIDLAADGTATSPPISSLSGGRHTITATFSGTTQIAGSVGHLDQVVNPAGSVTILTTAPNPSTFGASVTLTATVTGSGSPLTEGTVAFSEGGTILCEEVELTAGGTASCETDQLSVGTHTVTATYSGTGDYATSTGTDDQVVNRAATDVEIASSSNPATYGQPVIFTVTVNSANGSATDGTVDLIIDGTSVLVSGVDSAGQTTYTTDDLVAGTHTIRAEYSGSASFLPGVSPDLTLRVEITADAGGPYAISEGDSVTLDASGSSPTGDYQWDLNDDGVFGDATGIDPTLAWTDLESFGIDDGSATPTSYPIAVRIISNGVTQDAGSTITVSNTAPASVLTGGLAATVGQPFTIKVGADDQSSADMAADFTYTVDWGDGSPVLSVVGPADPPVTHTYATSGNFAASFTATDKDGGTGPGTQVIVVSANKSDDDSDDSDSDSSDSDSLASTGSPVGIAAVAATLLLLGGGAALTIAGRRRSRRQG